MLQLINGLPETPEFIAKHRPGRFGLDLAKEICRYNPVQWETPTPQSTKRWVLRDLFSSAKRRGPDDDIKRLCPKALEPGHPRLQRELVLFFDCMASAVAKYKEKYAPWRLSDQSEYREELFWRYAVLLNYLEQKMRRRFDSPVPGTVDAATQEDSKDVLLSSWDVPPLSEIW